MEKWITIPRAKMVTVAIVMVVKEVIILGKIMVAEGEISMERQVNQILSFPMLFFKPYCQRKVLLSFRQELGCKMGRTIALVPQYEYPHPFFRLF